MKSPHYFVIWDHPNSHNDACSQMRTSFTVKSSAIQYAKELRKSYPNVKNVEVAMTINIEEPGLPLNKLQDDYDEHFKHCRLGWPTSNELQQERIEDVSPPLCPVCHNSDAVVFHENIKRWICHHMHADCCICEDAAPEPNNECSIHGLKT